MAYDVDPIGLAKAILWEEAKGKLRALALAGGQNPSGTKRSPDWEKVTREIETFIVHFESNSYQE